MGKKRKKGKRNKRKLKKGEYEGYQVGPLTFERFGRVVRMQSDWDPVSFAKHISKIQKDRPTVKAGISRKISDLRDLMAQYDPIELLSAIAVRHCLTAPEIYDETTHPGREPYAEFALNLALSIKSPNFGASLDKGVAADIEKRIAEIFDDVFFFFMSESVGGSVKEGQELRELMLALFLGVRGDSFEQHHIELTRDLMQPHDAFFQNEYGFTTAEAVSYVKEIERQIQEHINNSIAMSSKGLELHRLFIEFTEDMGPDPFDSMEDLREKYNALPEVQEKTKEFGELLGLTREPFKVVANASLPSSFLELTSCGFGDNTDFFTFSKAPGWPTNNSVSSVRPLVKHGAAYYDFVPQILFRRLPKIMEEWISSANQKYFNDSYTERRGKLLEAKTVEYLETLLPGATTATSLFYHVVEDGEAKRPEADAVVIYDGNLFLVEAKAGSLALSARRGSLKALRGDSKNLIDDAYKQALRTKQYIESTASPVFEDEDGDEILAIDKSEIRNIYLLNVTLDNMGPLSTKLNSLKAFDHLKEDDWIWSVFINDLRVISEIIESPSEFLIYLQRRIRANDYPQFHTADELDFFMFFLYEGLYFEDGKLKNVDRFVPHGYTTDLDRYYYFLAGQLSDGDKPTMAVSDDFKSFVRSIESTGQAGRSDVATNLLGFDSATRQDILRRVSTAKALSLKDGLQHDITLGFRDLKLGITFSTSPQSNRGDLIQNTKYFERKMYQTRFEQWMHVALYVDSTQKDEIDLRYYQKEWRQSDDLDRETEVYQRYKISQHLQARTEPGRNDPCPCNSGRKYKKCCLRLVRG